MTAERAFPVAAVIVGAGAGRRFGGPKAVAVTPDGRRFIDAIHSVAANAGLEPIVAVLPPNVTPPANAVVVVNPDAASEQITSIRLGVSRLANHPVVGAVVWPVDHPFVSLETILALLDAARRTNAPIVVPTLDGRRGHPTFFHRDVWRDLLTTGGGGARTVVHGYGARAADVPVRDAGILRDVDTPADLERD